MTDAETLADPVLDFDYELDAAPEKVWRALTVPALVEAWLMPNTMRRVEEGERFTLDNGEDPPGQEIACEVLEATPPHRLSYSWREAGEAPAMVTFELMPNDTGGTNLRVIHGPLLALPRPANGNTPTMALAA
jgi:uncharacterized protein YndB with AHSA1/START domain